MAAAAQGQPKAQPAPRGADGHPSLSGVWTNASVTNLTRPPGVKLVVNKAEAGALLNETRALLGTAATRESLFQQIDRKAAESLHDRAKAFHNEFQNQQWGPVRIIHCWPLLLVEEGLALHTGLNRHPSDGYKLAADWTQNYDPSYGNGLNGPSRGKLDELVRFMFAVEGVEDHP